MQVSIQSAVPAWLNTSPPKQGGATAPTSEPGQPDIRKKIDFSNITINQLAAWISEQEDSGAMDRIEGASLINLLPGGDLTDLMDVPMNFRDIMIGVIEFHLDRGDAKATWYANLLARLDVFEAQSMTVSAMA